MNSVLLLLYSSSVAKTIVFGVAVCIYAITAAAFAHAECPPASSEIEIGAHTQYFTMGSYDDPGEIFKRPRAITDRAYKDFSSGEEHVVGEVDYHAVYPVDLKYYADALMNLDGQKRIQPRVVGSSVLCSNERIVPNYYRMRMTVQIKFLFFHSTYESLFNIYIHTPSPESEYRQVMTLYESLDEKLVVSRGTWFLKEIEVDGRTATYVRYYYKNGFTSDAGGLKMVLKRFSKRQVRQTMNNFYKEAERLELDE